MPRQIIFHGDYFTDFYGELEKKDYFESKK